MQHPQGPGAFPGSTGAKLPIAPAYFKPWSDVGFLISVSTVKNRVDDYPLKSLSNKYWYGTGPMAVDALNVNKIKRRTNFWIKEKNPVAELVESVEFGNLSYLYYYAFLLFYNITKRYDKNNLQICLHFDIKVFHFYQNILTMSLSRHIFSDKNQPVYIALIDWLWRHSNHGYILHPHSTTFDLNFANIILYTII